jgi:hypothetical protein
MFRAAEVENPELILPPIQKIAVTGGNSWDGRYETTQIASLTGIKNFQTAPAMPPKALFLVTGPF